LLLHGGWPRAFNLSPHFNTYFPNHFLFSPNSKAEKLMYHPILLVVIIGRKNFLSLYQDGVGRMDTLNPYLKTIYFKNLPF
ncbi:MAG: hypothetical protein ABEH43_09710, partial [Flavobacteriales bacterium]